MKEQLESFETVLAKARQEIAKVMIGQKQVVDQALVAVLTGNHALIEGVPGVAKTLLVRTLARVLGGDFNRIQFTPDLMPADITGTHVYNLQKNLFSLVKGPVFTTFLLADEINRAPAKTQSALLQAMQERVVSIDRKHYRLSRHFTVFATQNPIEFEGTYPLPEAQKDRFMLKITMHPPGEEEERTLAKRMLGEAAPEAVLGKGGVQPVLDLETFPAFQRTLMDVLVREELIHYVVEIIRRTRAHQSLLVGASPRATQALLLSSRASAAMEGRDFVSPDDIKAMALPVLEHRLILRPEYEIEGMSVPEVIDDILQGIAVPR
ncbi:MAG: MoxR family ATPase [Desulfobacteraceae bacterium]|jgi:MoxR-like ATPase